MSGTVETAALARPPVGARPARPPRRRRPSGAPPLLPPHPIRITGVGWLSALIVGVVAAVVVYRNGLTGVAIPATVVDDTVVRWIASVHAPGLHTAARVVADVSSWWTIQALVWGVPLAILVFRRWRHLLVAMVGSQLAQLASQLITDHTMRPRPFGVRLAGGWGGWALPSLQMLAITGMLVTALYTLAPVGRWRNTAKWVLAGLLALVALARMYLGVDAPTDIAVAVAIGVSFPVVGFRVFAPNDAFPVTYRRGRAAHLDVGGARGVAIRQALKDQLGLVVTDVRPVGLGGSAGSTPLRLQVEGSPAYYLFGKLYSQTHLRSDRWYKLGRELLYGRLEDEKPFHGVRRLVQQEDYALRLVRDAGLASARPFGFVELTPDREYLLVTEFFDDAVELGESTIDDSVIDSGLRVIRQLWDAGLAHRDVKPANIMVRDGQVLLIDVAFAEVRPSPWRQAVDLANMMLCLALRTSATQVYERARLQFTVQEISEAFAAARGLAMPSQLRHALRHEGHDLHGEFLRLLPERPAPMRIQRWTARRIGIWLCLAAGLVLVGLNYVTIFGNSQSARTPLLTANLDCPPTSHLAPLWLEAQAVQTAGFVPCVEGLPVGWSFGDAYANSGRASFVLNHDRAGPGALEVTLAPRCDVAGAPEAQGRLEPGRRYVRTTRSGPVREQDTYDVFAGGCITTRLTSQSAVGAVWFEVGNEARSMVGYIPRSTLGRELSDRSDGRLHLDPTT